MRCGGLEPWGIGIGTGFFFLNCIDSYISPCSPKTKKLTEWFMSSRMKVKNAEHQSLKW